jgi:hypothetical protein
MIFCGAKIKPLRGTEPIPTKSRSSKSIWRHHIQLIFNINRFPEFVQEIGSEPIDIGFSERSQTSRHFRCNHMTGLNELIHDFALIVDVHKDQNIGDQMTVLNNFPLFIWGIRSNEILVSKSHELNEVGY